MNVAAAVRIGAVVAVQLLPSLAGAGVAPGSGVGASRLSISQIVAMPADGGLSPAPLAQMGADPVVRLFAAAGEFESARIRLRNDGDSPADVLVGISDLTNAVGTAVIASKDVDVRLVKAWYQGASAWSDISKSSRADFSQKLVPELLLKDDSLVKVDYEQKRNLLKVLTPDGTNYIWVNQSIVYESDSPPPTEAKLLVRDSETLQSFELRPRQERDLWLTIRIPEQATAGRYAGVLRVAVAGSVTATVPIEIVVYPFALAEPTIVYSIYYRAQIVKQGSSVGSEYRTSEQMVADLRDMANHGVVFPTMYQYAKRPDLVREAFLARQAAGARAGPLFYLGIETTEGSLAGYGASPIAALESVVPRIMQVAGEFGYSPVYFYGRDEAAGQALVSQRALWRTLQRLGARVFVAGSTGSHRLVGDILDVQINYGPVDGGVARAWHSTGKKVFSYANPQSGPENPFLFRLNYGLLLWANQYDGAMPYAYQHCFGSCWNDIDHPVYRDHNMTYPTVNGSIPTLAWEGLREGVDDVRYVEALERRILASDSGSPATGSATTFLESLRGQIVSAAAAGGRYNRYSRMDLDAVRRRVVSKIGEIDGAVVQRRGQ